MCGVFFFSLCNENLKAFFNSIMFQPCSLKAPMTLLPSVGKCTTSCQHIFHDYQQFLVSKKMSTGYRLFTAFQSLSD